MKSSSSDGLQLVFDRCRCRRAAQNPSHLGGAVVPVGLGEPVAIGNLAAGWDGAHWSLETVPNLGATLNGVSCAAASACIAVGYSPAAPIVVGGPGSVQQDYVWDGTTWTAQQLPTRSGRAAGSLNAVSCTSSTVCTAVGFNGLSMPIALRSS